MKFMRVMRVTRSTDPAKPMRMSNRWYEYGMADKTDKANLMQDNNYKYKHLNYQSVN